MSYQAPTDLDTALALFASEGGKLVAGGTDVYPATLPGQRPEAILDVTRIADLNGISAGPDGYRIGAATTWSQIISYPLPQIFDGLKAAALEVGGIQIQNAGTIAGNICNASPAADGVPPLLTLDASVEMASAARGVRVVALSDFITGVRKTALAPDEIVTAILVPASHPDARSSFEKLGSRRFLVISIVMTAVVVEMDEADCIAELRVAVGACSPVSKRLILLENDAIGARPEEIVVTAEHLAGLSPIDDIRGSAEYRMDVVREQVRRAICRAASHE